MRMKAVSGFITTAMATLAHSSRPASSFFSSLVTDRDVRPNIVRRSTSSGGTMSVRNMSHPPHRQLVTQQPRSRQPAHPSYLKKKHSFAAMSAKESPVSVSTRPKSPQTTKITRFAPTDKIVEFEDEKTHVFEPKSGWATRRKTKCHPYQGEVPYMQSYGRVSLDNDRYCNLLLQRLTHGMPSFHDFGRKPPATALDLGCGEGHWALHAANVWKNCQITAMDLVNILHPSFETTENAHFVQGNFVSFSLPFPDNSFEFVRMANLILAVPFDRWQYLLREAYRVLAVGGTLELIDDQLFFPYAKPPQALEKRHSSGPGRYTSYFDDFDDDSDTALEENSSSESTLLSESSFDARRRSNLATSETIRALDASNLHPPAPLTPTPGSEPRLTAWERKARDSRELEAVFEQMLTQQFGVFPRPSEFIEGTLGQIFGRKEWVKKRSFHIKLAPVDSPIGIFAEDHDDDGIRSPSLVPKNKKSWMEWDKKKRKVSGTQVKVVDDSLLLERPSLDDFNAAMLSTPLPANVNAKAAERLGVSIPKAPRQKSLPAIPPQPSIRPRPTRLTTSPTPSLDRSASTDSSPSPPTPPSAKAPVLSAKAAGRLGISYAELTTITAASPNHLLTNFVPVQSPGIFIWPSTYIPMTPLELEMHACRNVHTLIDCKAALGDYVTGFTDGDGKPLIGDGQFDDLLWDYECFRRSRFNWPADPVDPLEDEPSMPPLTRERSALSIPDREGKVSNLKSSSVESFNAQFRDDDLVHIRTLRVFDVVKR